MNQALTHALNLVHSERKRARVKNQNTLKCLTILKESIFRRTFLIVCTLIGECTFLSSYLSRPKINGHSISFAKNNGRKAFDPVHLHAIISFLLLFVSLLIERFQKWPTHRRTKAWRVFCKELACPTNNVSKQFALFMGKSLRKCLLSNWEIKHSIKGH